MLLNCGVEKTLQSPLDCKEIKTEAEAPKRATWREELTHWKRPWCWEGLKAGGEGAEDEMVGWCHQLNGFGFEQTPGVNSIEGLKDRESWCPALHWVSKSWTRLSNWTTTKRGFHASACILLFFFFNLFLAVLDLHCCMQAFSSCSKWGFSCFGA